MIVPMSSFLLYHTRLTNVFNHADIRLQVVLRFKSPVATVRRDVENFVGQRCPVRISEGDD